MQLPRFTKVHTDGYPSYRFEHNGQTYEAFRFASGAGAWSVDRVDGNKMTRVVTAEDTRKAAVTKVIEAPEPAADPEPAAEPAEFWVEVDRRVQARPRVFEDRYRIHQRGLADPIERFAVPYRSDRNDRTTLEFRGWKIVGEIEYVAGLNVFRARVERTPVEYGNSGHWISAHVVDPHATRPEEHRYVAVAKCGAYLIEKTDTPRGHALCVACTGDPVEVNYLRDREGWLKDGGRPVKVLRALSYHDRIIASTVTTDVTGAAREWYEVRCDARASEIDFAPEADSRPGLRQTCLNALCTKDYGHTRRDGDECGNALTAAGGGGQRPAPATPLDGPRVGERVKYSVGRHTVHATVTRLANDEGKVGVVDDGDQTGAVRPVHRTMLTAQTPNLDDLHGNALEEDRLRDLLLGKAVLGVTEEAPGPKCRHGFALRPGVVSTLPCEPRKSYGVFGDEGMIDGSDCAVQAANNAAFYTAEDDGDTTYVVAVVCPEHDEQRADACEECFAEPDAGDDA